MTDSYDPKKHFNPAIQQQLNKEEVDELINQAARAGVEKFLRDNPYALAGFQPTDTPRLPTVDHRAYTSDEVTQQFLEQVAHQIHYWQTDPACGTMERRVAGVVHSVFSTLDGSTALPAFDLVPSPHESDKQFHIDQGEKYYDPSAVVSVSLHSELYPTLKRLYPEPDAPSRRNEMSPEEMREKFVSAVCQIADQAGLLPTPQAAAHQAVRQTLTLLDGQYATDIPPMMVTAAPTDAFQREQAERGLKTWCEHIPVARREATYGFSESLTDAYDRTRERQRQAGRDLFN